jgi:hypothetical protein
LFQLYLSLLTLLRGLMGDTTTGKEENENRKGEEIGKKGRNKERKKERKRRKIWET